MLDSEIKAEEIDNSSQLLYEVNSQENVKYTIVIPTYKRELLIQRALISAISQDYNDYEIIIVDNDNDFQNNVLLEYLKELAIGVSLKYYKNRLNLGAEGNFNRGMELAKGEYLCWLHDDDYYETNFLSTMDKYVCGRKAILSVYNSIVENAKVGNYVDKQSSPIVKVARKLLHILYSINPKKNQVENIDLLARTCDVGTIGTVYNRQALLSIGGFDRAYYPGTDYELNFRYINAFGGVRIKERVVNYVIGENDSLDISRTFAKFDYNLTGVMISKGLIKDNRINDYVRRYLYFANSERNKAYWGHDTVDAIEGIKPLTTKERFLARAKIRLRSSIRFGE